MNQTQPKRNDAGGKPKAKPPVHTVRFGPVKAVVWENQTQHGPMHNVTVARAYKDDDGEWQETSSFGVDDLLPLAKALSDAHSWIHEQRQSKEPEQHQQAA